MIKGIFMKRDRFILFGIIVLILIALVGVILLAIQNQRISALLKPWEGLKVGEKVLVFAARDINGRKADIRDTYAMLIFFKTVCDACREGAPSWQKFYDQYASQGVRVIGLSPESDIKIKQFVRRSRITFPVIADPKRRIIWKYKVQYVPLIVLLDRDGKIFYYQPYGEKTTKALQEAEKILIRRLRDE